MYRWVKKKIAYAYLSLRKKQQFLWRAVQNEWTLWTGNMLDCEAGISALPVYSFSVPLCTYSILLNISCLISGENHTELVWVLWFIFFLILRVTAFPMCSGSSENIVSPVWHKQRHVSSKAIRRTSLWCFFTVREGWGRSKCLLFVLLGGFQMRRKAISVTFPETLSFLLGCWLFATGASHVWSFCKVSCDPSS